MIERVLNELVDGSGMSAVLLVLIRTTLILGVGLLLVRGLRGWGPTWRSLVVRPSLVCAVGGRIQKILKSPRYTLLSRRGRVMMFAGALVAAAAVTRVSSTEPRAVRNAISETEAGWRVPAGY